MKDIRTTKRLLVISSLLLLCAGAVSAWRWWAHPFQRERFNKEAWVSEAEMTSGGYRRIHMTQDVMDSVLVKGVSFDAMKQALGKPDIFRPSETDGSGTVTYYLGCMGMIPTHYVLRIGLQKDGMVASKQILADEYD